MRALMAPVSGTYLVLLPDGRTQTVTCTADAAGYGGHVADVQYSGYAAPHPPTPLYKPAPAYKPVTSYKPAPKPVYHSASSYKPAPKLIYHPAPAPKYHQAPAPIYHA